MTDRERLLAAVLASPYEDAPRLAYAAWLEGLSPADPQGEFIRLSIRCARQSLGDRLPKQDWLELLDAHERLGDLRARHESEWKRPVLKIASDCQLERGLVASVRLPARTFLDRADELFALAPIVHVDLSDVRPLLLELVRSPHLRRVRALSLEWQGLTSAEIAHFAGSPHLANLWCLELRGNALDLAGLRALAKSPSLAGLRHTELASNLVTAHEEAGVEGSAIASIWFPPDGEQLEAELGRIPWLHYPAAAWSDFPLDPCGPPPA